VTAFAFGDSAKLADELGPLVVHGAKKATAELVQATPLSSSICVRRLRFELIPAGSCCR
jgi:uncharacterized protein YhfF